MKRNTTWDIKITHNGLLMLIYFVLISSLKKLIINFTV